MNDEKPMFPNIKSTSKMQREIWNEAIEAVIEKLKKDFVASEVVIEIIREVKR